MDEQRTLTAISPLDGRYAAKCDACRELFSEQGLMHRRLLTEIRWLQFMSKRPEITDFPAISPVVHDWLDHLVRDFGSQEAIRIKALEKSTNHDVKAVEYSCAEQLAEWRSNLRGTPFVHFRLQILKISQHRLCVDIAQRSDSTSFQPCVALSSSSVRWRGRPLPCPCCHATHGQAASPTTLARRGPTSLASRSADPEPKQCPCSRTDGAVGNFNAHVIGIRTWTARSVEVIH